MRPIDSTIFFVYLAFTVLLGVAFARRREDSEGFFLAGRSMGWLPVGLSVMATAFSAMHYVAFSGEVFRHGLYVALSVPVFAMVAWPITRIVMPFYHSMRLTSAYEYLERRFDVRVRCLASALFVVWRIFWMATALYASCKVLGLITHINIHTLIVLAGAAAIVYTVVGGMRAVMWTDVAQFFVLFGGLVVGVAVAASRTSGGWGGMMRTAAEGGCLKPFYPFDPQMFSFDPRVRITLWSAWIGTMTMFLARYGADQVVVQRYFAAKSLKTAQRGFRLNYVCAIATLTCLAFLGFAIHAHASAAGMVGVKGLKPIHHFTSFVRTLPYGLCGLLLAGLFAATMSSVDSGMNSCSAALATDFYARLTGRAPSPWLNRGLTFALGAGATAMACYVGRLGSIFEIASKIVNGFGSPLLALFVLGMFSRRANAWGMLVGGALGAAGSAWVSFTVKPLALHYYAVVNLVGTLGVCYGLSLLFAAFGAGSTDEQVGWMWSKRDDGMTG